MRSHPQDANEAAQHRVLAFYDSMQVVQTISGDSIYSVTDRGVVVADGLMRIFIPWNQVIEFRYHTADTAVRKRIQGY